MYCNDQMLRIIGRTIEFVIGRSPEQLEGIETEAKEVHCPDSAPQKDKSNEQRVQIIDIIDASGNLHKGSAVSSKFIVSSSSPAVYVFWIFFCAAFYFVNDFTTSIVRC
jgi:hypothetical protein